MPGPSKQVLTPEDLKLLRAAEAKVAQAAAALEEARLEWAELVAGKGPDDRGLGISAVARALDLTPQAVAERVKVIERRAAKRQVLPQECRNLLRLPPSNPVRE